MEFGTDGVRGRAGVAITVDLASRLGNAVVRVLGGDVWVARDTRPSSPELAEAVCAGVVAAGGRATLLGVLPTPGLSVRVRDERGSAGVMVTASHNPPEDNGLKVVGGDGGKVDRGALSALTLAMPQVESRPGGSRRALTGVDEYVSYLLRSLPSGAWLSGRRVLFDAAAGAGAEAGAQVLRALGAEVIPFAGPAINVDCGAVHPEHAARAVKETDADLGILLDGDGDRIALVDGAGRVLDGDALLWLCRQPPLMVGTVMTNLGLERALQREGIGLHRTPVGDAHVAAAMLELGATVGGEPSGHLVFANGPPTADGLYAGLRAVAQVPDLATTGFTPSAQAHLALRDVVLKALDFGFVKAAGGRAVVRKSGTEPVVRVMVEHEDPAVAARLKDRVVALILESQ